MNYILEYWEAIESGKVVTSRRVRAVYERLAREIREPDPASPYYFDEDVGDSTKPSKLALHGSISPCPAFHGRAFLCFYA